jgi:hypothetical protein
MAVDMKSTETDARDRRMSENSMSKEEAGVVEEHFDYAVERAYGTYLYYNCFIESMKLTMKQFASSTFISCHFYRSCTSLTLLTEATWEMRRLMAWIKI